jgi:hypothetical protein
MKILVINLPHRKDKLDLFMQRWSWLGDIEVVPGQRSDIPHTGCGLAHVLAAKIGLSNSEWCLVFEDDAEIDCSHQEFLDGVHEATSRVSEWDCVLLSPAHMVDPVSVDTAPLRITRRISDSFVTCPPNKSLSSTACLLWSKTALPMIAEYETLLKDEHIFPIDRAIMFQRWESKHQTGFHTPTWIPKYDTVELKNKLNVWIKIKHIVFQTPGIVSDNTLEPGADHLKHTLELLQTLFSS